MVPISVTVWLAWSRNVNFGYWFVTAQCIAWTLGTAKYYMIPTMGPNFAFSGSTRSSTAPGPDTWSTPSGGVARTSCTDPLTNGVQSVAGFASLHVGSPC